ncbi:MAG: hypothetical protein V7637_2638 [Mycobacteriales bacterium]
MSTDAGGEPGRLVREHRAAAGLSQKGLAALSGVSLRTLRDIERGRVLQPHARSLRRLADALSLTGAEWGRLTDAVQAVGNPASSAGLWIGVLGPFELRRRGQGVPIASAKLRRLLGLLALHAPYPVGTDEIVSVLWDGEPPETRSDLVKGYVARLRELLRPGRGHAAAPLLVRRDAGYALTCTPQQLDVRQFEDLAARAERAGRRGDRAGALRLWDEALRCWRGPLLPDADPAVREHPAAVAVSRRRRDGVLEYADLRMAAGEHRLAAAALHELAGAEPLHEGLHARLMLALAGSGQQAAAFTVYADIRARLAAELAVEPGEELRSAHRALLHPATPAPVTPATPAPTGPAPAGAAAAAGAPAERAPVEPAAERAQPIPAQLPPALRTFTGRREPLRRLGELPRPGRAAPPMLAAISGSAGVGKTTLAIHWAHRNAGRYPDGQLYVNLRGYDPSGHGLAPAEALRGFLDALGVPPRQVPSGLDALAGLYRSLLAGKRVLVVLDNARDAEQVRPLLPGSHSTGTIVTSRNPLTSLVATDGAHPVELGLLTAAEASELIARRLGAGRVAAEPDAVREIVAACAGLPLALTVVAARAAIHPGFPLAALATELTGAPAGEVRAVFSWSYATLTPPAARLFRQLGLHPGPDIAMPAAASLAGVAPPVAGRLLAELTGASLLTEHAPGRYAFHDLLRAYAADLARQHDPATARRAAAGRLLDHYLHAAHDAARLVQQRDEILLPLAPAAAGVTPERPGDFAAATAWLTAEYRVLLAWLDRSARDGSDVPAWQLAWALDTYLDRAGHWPDLLDCWRVALTAAERLADPLAQAHVHRRMARMCTLLRRSAEAEEHLRRAIALYAGVGDQVGQARAHMQFGFVWTERGRPDRGLEHVRRALVLCRAIGNERGEANALNNSGWCQALLGNYQQARVDCEAAVALNRRLADRLGEAGALDSLGYAHHHLGQHAAALRCYEQALALHDELGSRFDAAQTLDHLGDTHHATGDPDAARGAWQRALDGLSALGHPDAAGVRAKLSTVDGQPTRPGPRSRGVGGAPPG